METRDELTYKELAHKFSWGICRGVLRDPVSIKGCKHTFCEDWLAKHRAIIEECPYWQEPIEGVIRFPEFWDIGKNILHLLDLQKETDNVIQKLKEDNQSIGEMHKFIMAETSQQNFGNEEDVSETIS